jgi:hypothetical protein
VVEACGQIGVILFRGIQEEPEFESMSMREIQHNLLFHKELKAHLTSTLCTGPWQTDCTLSVDDGCKNGAFLALMAVAYLDATQ